MQHDLLGSNSMGRTFSFYSLDFLLGFLFVSLGFFLFFWIKKKSFLFFSFPEQEGFKQEMII